MINVVCVNAGTFYSTEYVNILADMVLRNLDKGTAIKFICFTDNPTGLDIDIEARPLHRGLNGWWNKLYLFKDGHFNDGDRVVYFDLKNVVVSALDDVLAYDGDFAICRDFLRPDGWQSGLMSWKANTLGFIWDCYEQNRFPIIDGGDQTWIENIFTNKDEVFLDKESFPPCMSGPPIKVDHWQDLFPGQFVSYKTGNCITGIPKGAKVVFFHGEPRPDQIKEGWVPQVWKIGGGTSLELMMQCNTSRADVIGNIRHNLMLGANVLKGAMQAHDRHAVIVGGAPSIKNYVEELKMRVKCGQNIIALNNSWRWCEENGIHVNSQVMVDARWENIDFVPPEGSPIHRLYATQCNKMVTEFSGKDCLTLWNSLVLDLVPDFDKTDHMFWVGAGTTVGIRSIFLMYAMGYREFHLYGFDSCYDGDQGHAYAQNLNVGERVIDVQLGDRKFKAAPWMISQVHDFLETAEYFTGLGCVFTIHGDGLLQYAAQTGLIPINIEATDNPQIVKIDGMYWPAYDRICSPSMRATVNDVDSYIKETTGRKVAVQAGGNVGVFPKRMAQSFERVYTFEPDMLNFECMKRNCTEENIICENSALGETEGFVGIKPVDKNCGANHVEGNGDIPVKTIDGMQLENCDLIQLDIEGYEMKALKGAVKTIEKFHPVIVIEENGLSLRYGVENGDVGKWLAQFGYAPANSVHRDLIFKHNGR